MFIKIFKESKGDTIVEVLLSIAVLSLVLTMSYALANRDSEYIQQAQERGEAQNISEQQLELLRNYINPDNADWKDGSGTVFKCFDDGDPAHNVQPQPTTDDSKCYKGIKDTVGGVSRGRYHTSISFDDITKTYTVNTTWSSFTNSTGEALAFSYKLPPSLVAPDQFLLPPGSTVTVVAQTIPPRAPDLSLVSDAGDSRLTSCSDSGRQNKSGTTVQARYVDIHGNPSPWQVSSTDSSATHVFPGFQNYGQYQATASRGGYSVCGTDPQQALLNRPATNLNFNVTLKPNCTVTYDYIRTDPIWSVGWVQDVPIYGNVPIYGWIYQDWFWWSYWPPGYGSVNPPYNTIFENGGNRLELREVRYGHPNANYRYDHYVWGVTGYSWQITGWGWRSYNYISGYTDVYAWRNHCPS